MLTTTQEPSAGASSDSLAAQFRQLIDGGRADEVVRQAGELDDGTLREAPELELEVARALARIGKFERAMALATTALWGFRVRRELRGQMRANLVLGGIAFEQGHPHAAEHHFGLVRVLATSLDDRRVQSQVTNNLACLALQRGDFDAAEALLQSALKLARDLADLRAQAEVFHNLNLAYRGLGKFEAGAKAGQQALVLGEEMSDWSMMALALCGLAETTSWIEMGSDQDTLLDRAAASARAADDIAREAMVGRVRAVLGLRRKHYDAAYQHAFAAREQAERAQHDLLATECTAIMAVAKKRLGAQAEAAGLKELAGAALYRLKAHLEADWFEREWAVQA
ncbi:MAG: tetratricopeptide repeat protein [Gemmatimonadales bacterium]